MLKPETLASMGRDLMAIPAYPSDQHDLILRMLDRFVDTPEHLRWLVDTAVMYLPRWEGVPALRGLYCTRYKPADGIEADCTIPGFTPADNEMAYYENKANEEQRKLLKWQHEAAPKRLQ